MSRRLRITVFVAVVPAVWTAMHLYVGWRLLPLTARSGGPGGLLAVLTAAWLSCPLGRLLFAAGVRGPGRALEYAGAVWMGLLFLLLAAFAAADLATAGGVLLRPWLGGIRTTAAIVVPACGVLPCAWAHRRKSWSSPCDRRLRPEPPPARG